MTLIVAHRGASKRAHENTLAAFEQAVALGADMIELDVRRTVDGALVVFHDPGFGSPHSKTLIAAMTLGQVQRYAARKNFRIPTLDEAFRSLAGRVRLDIELKEAGYADRVVSLARRRFDPAACVFTSFDPRIIAEVKKSGPGLATGLILANAAALAWCDAVPVDVFAPGKRLFSSHRRYFARARSAGKRIAVWTVDGRSLLSRLLADPVVDAIITNYPDRALRLREKAGIS